MLFHLKYALWLCFYIWMKEKISQRFLNLPISQKWLLMWAIWPIVAGGHSFVVFCWKKSAFYRKTFKLIFSLNAAIILSKEHKKNQFISLFAIKKINNFNTFSRQAWFPAVTDTSYFSFLNPQNFDKFKLTYLTSFGENLSMTRYIFWIGTIVFYSKHDMNKLTRRGKILDISLMMCKYYRQ